MVSRVAYQDVFIALETFERGLNLLGYIPGVGTITAICRATYAKAEIIMGIAIGIFALACKIEGKVDGKVYLAISTVFLLHGLLNVVRSGFEVVPFVPLVTTLPYDLFATFYLGRRFFSYV